MKISEIEKLLEDNGLILKDGEYLLLKFPTDNFNNAQALAQRLGEMFPALRDRVIVFYGDTDIHILNVENDHAGL